jgi:glycosyltransferase involved in cell wall biosynthesis
MPTIAYIANQFPSPVEPYVFEEVLELRRREVTVITASGRAVDDGGLPPELRELARETAIVSPPSAGRAFQAIWLLVREARSLSDLLWRIALRGNESPALRLRALVHTWLGACYALTLRGQRVELIHVHHGYFASWIAMVGARLLHVPFSMTLHGSDLLLNGSYLDVKLQNCATCFTVSEFNRRFIRRKFPLVAPSKIVVQRMGVEVSSRRPAKLGATGRALSLLAVGRLHPVKDHAFLIEGCARLRQRGTDVRCRIVGDGPLREELQKLVTARGLQKEVQLLGQVEHGCLSELYREADLVVLTSRSEGLPLVLMEAMALGKIVLAPAMNGIPELVSDGETGFLYAPGSLDSFVSQVELTMRLGPAREAIGRRAAAFVNRHHHRARNQERFCQLLLAQIPPTTEPLCHEDPVLQQI